MKSATDNLLSQFAQNEGRALAFDFTCGEEIDMPEYNDTVAISFKNGENTFHFFEDRDNNGILDDKTELLGAKYGWAELQAYDTNGDGKIDGEELENLKVVKINEKTGKYEFMTAKDAGISQIDLTTLAGIDTTLIEQNLADMALDIKMMDGTLLTAIQDEDIFKFMEKEYSMIFGTKIVDYEEKNELEYMEEFVNKMDIQGPIEGV